MFWSEAPLRRDQLYDEKGVSLYIPEPIFAENPFTGPHSLRRLRLGAVDDLRLINDPDTVKWPQHAERYRRLDEFIRLDWGPNNTSVYVVDHHHFALFGWAEAIKEGKIKPGALLRHYDDHSDAGQVDHVKFMTKKVFKQRKWDLNDILDKVKIIGCWQFIMPAKKMGLIDEFVHIRAGRETWVQDNNEYIQMSMRSYKEKRPRRKIFGSEIVDIDVDYFASAHLNPDDEEADIQTMRADIAAAGVATLATSPGFIDPGRAVELIKRILA